MSDTYSDYMKDLDRLTKFKNYDLKSLNVFRNIIRSDFDEYELTLGEKEDLLGRINDLEDLIK